MQSDGKFVFRVTEGYKAPFTEITNKVYPGNEIGDNVFIGHYALIRSDNFIGNNVSIGSYTEIAHNVVIGNDVRIHSQCFICEHSILRDGCWIGPGVRLINDYYPNSGKSIKASPVISEGAKIGAASVILPGITIGQGALIGAASVVTKDVPPYQVWCGNPAKYLKFIDTIEAYQ